MFGPFRTKRPAAARTPVKQRLFVSHLEDRSLPSVAAGMAGDTLVIKGTDTGPMADRIRILGDTVKTTNVVRVFDGQREVGMFKGVANIEVRATSNSTVAVDLNDYPSINNVFIKETAPGTNAISFGRGTITNVNIAGNSGTDTVTVNGLTAGNFAVDTGLGSDQVNFGSASLKQVTVSSAESVDLSGTQAGDVTLDNRSGPLTVTTTGNLNSLRVFAGSGALSLGGSVAGDVTFNNFGALDTDAGVTGASLKVTGKVGGALQMTGTGLDDNVAFGDGSAVSGNVEINLGAGNDSASFAGTRGKTGTSVSIDLGAGDDNVTLMAPAALNATKTSIMMGAGNDVATVSTSGTQLDGLTLDGGDGKDILRTGGSEATFDNSNFEVHE